MKHATSLQACNGDTCRLPDYWRVVLVGAIGLLKYYGHHSSLAAAVLYTGFTTGLHLGMVGHNTDTSNSWEAQSNWSSLMPKEKRCPSKERVALGIEGLVRVHLRCS